MARKKRKDNWADLTDEEKEQFFYDLNEVKGKTKYLEIVVEQLEERVKRLERRKGKKKV